MVTEAYDARGTKYKVGMEVMLPSGAGLWYITKIELGSDNKVSTLFLINNTFNELITLHSLKSITLTGYFKPEFSKIAKELDKRDYFLVKKNIK